MVIGDKNKIALDVSLIDENKNKGKLFLYIRGIKFGNNCENYNVKRSLRNILDCFNITNADLKNLFNCPITIIFDAYAQAIDNELWLEQFNEQYFSCNHINSPIDEYYNNFMRDYALENHLDHLCFRLGEYTFDFDEIYIIPNGHGQIRVCAKNQYEELAEEFIDEIEFINIWQMAYNHM